MIVDEGEIIIIINIVDITCHWGPDHNINKQFERTISDNFHKTFPQTMARPDQMPEKQ